MRSRNRSSVSDLGPYKTSMWLFSRCCLMLSSSDFFICIRNFSFCCGIGNSCGVTPTMIVAVPSGELYCAFFSSSARFAYAARLTVITRSLFLSLLLRRTLNLPLHRRLFLGFESLRKNIVILIPRINVSLKQMPNHLRHIPKRATSPRHHHPAEHK